MLRRTRSSAAGVVTSGTIARTPDASAEQEPERVRQTPRPVSLVVGPLRVEDVPEPIGAVALRLEQGDHAPDVGDVPPRLGALARELVLADVEVDARVGERRSVDDPEDGAARVPQSRAQRPGEAEHARLDEDAVEADQAAERGAEEAGRLTPGKRPEIAVDERFDGLREEAEVLASAAARNGVLVRAGLVRVRDADDDRLGSLVGEQLHCLVDLPLPGEARLVVEEVLAVVHVHDREAPGAGRVSRRQVDVQVAGIAELRACDVAEDADVADCGCSSERFPARHAYAADGWRNGTSGLQPARSAATSGGGVISSSRASSGRGRRSA